MSSLNSWPILSLVSLDIASKIHKAFVFGQHGNEAVIISANGDVFGVGFNGNGCLGVGDSRSTLEVKKIEVLCQQKILQMAYGMGPHVLAVTDSGELYSWGHGGYGQLGHNELEKSVPMLVGMSKKVVQVACGSYHSIALTDDGEIFAWGSNNCGQLGLGIANNQPTPKKINGHLTTCSKKVVAVSCGQSFTISLTEDGELFSWGYNGNGQLGIGSNTNQQLPTRVTGLNGKYIENVACGMAHVLALTDTGEMYSWGANAYGQLGLGTTLNISNPQLLSVIEEGWSDVAAHHYNHISAGVSISGKIFMWGQCHGLTLLSPREVAVSNVDEVFACFGMPSIMFRFLHINNEKKRTVKDDMAEAFNDKNTGDLKFLVDGKDLYVHKALLKIRSDYFRRMLQSCWEENDKTEIEMTQFSYDVFKAFLRYLYTDEIDISPEEAVGLLDLADSYCETQLKSLCEEVIRKGTTVANVALFLAAAIKYKAKELEEFCFRFALNHLTAVTQTQAFRDLDGETVKSLMVKAGSCGIFKR